MGLGVALLYSTAAEDRVISYQEVGLAGMEGFNLGGE